MKATIETKTPKPGSLHRLVGGRSNPKRLTELADALYDLREWARVEVKITARENERAINKVWHEILDWADGRALRHNLNLAAVQSEREGARALQATPDANGEARLETRLSAGGESSNYDYTTAGSYIEK